MLAKKTKISFCKFHYIVRNICFVTLNKCKMKSVAILKMVLSMSRTLNSKTYTLRSCM